MLVALSVAMVAILAVGGSLAYFTQTKVADNVFTVGNVRITLTEPAWDDPDGGGRADGDTVYPGEPLAKDPTVTNIGANPCFVRIQVTGLDCLVPDPEAEDAADYMITLRNVSPDWTYYEGYYYYNKVLNCTSDTEHSQLLTATPELFTHIVIPTAIENIYEPWWQYNVKVTAQAVQAQKARPSFDNGVLLMTVEEIANWFGTCGL